MYFPPSSAVKLGVQKHSNRRRVSGGENFLRRNDIDIPTAGDFFSRRFTAAMFAGIVLQLMDISWEGIQCDYRQLLHVGEISRKTRVE